MLPEGNSSKVQRQTQDQSGGVKGDTPTKWYPKKSGCSHFYMRETRFQDKKCNKRQRWTF